MKINLAKSAGFCFGVKRALDITFKTAASKQKAYILGDIVHNEEVIKKVEDAGIKKISKLGLGRNNILLIRAHGASAETFEKAKKHGYKIIDATCPMVKEIHKLAKKAESDGYKIIIIGDKNHDEVHGIIGQLKSRAIVIDKIKNIPFKKIKNIRKAAVLCQSTQKLENVLKILDALKVKIKQLKFFNTICSPTKIKQEEIKKMPLENDLIIIIGSKNSANTKRLFEISKSINPKTYWVSSKNDLKAVWFKKVQSVGVTAGASTPDSITRAVIGQIYHYSQVFLADSRRSFFFSANPHALL